MEKNELKVQVEYFYKNKIPVYICKNNGRFYRGLILEFSGDMIILDDRVLGAMPIYFLEIKIIEKEKDAKETIN